MKRVTSLACFFLLLLLLLFFCSDERLYKDLYFDYIFIGNKRQSDGINGEPRVNWFPWSCSDIFCIHNISSTKSIANQSLSITAILSCHATRKSGTLKDETAVWDGRPIPYELDQPIIVSSRKVSPLKGTKEALRDKKKSCCTGLTCQHNNTKSWYCYYSLILTIWCDESSPQRAKKKITKNHIFAPCALQSIFVECYSKEIETAPKLDSPY